MEEDGVVLLEAFPFETSAFFTDSTELPIFFEVGVTLGPDWGPYRDKIVSDHRTIIQPLSIKNLNQPNMKLNCTKHMWVPGLLCLVENFSALPHAHRLIEYRQKLESQPEARAYSVLLVLTVLLVKYCI